jgi:glutamyl-tRNA reductase
MRGRLQGVTPEQLRAIETLANGIAQKLLHRPMTALRQAASETGDDGPDLAGAVQQLFGLEVEAEAAAAEVLESPRVASLEPVP